MAREEQLEEKTVSEPIQKPKRIGIAEGIFQVPDDFTVWDEEIIEMFGENNAES